jgi:hypothetical protein
MVKKTIAKRLWERRMADENMTEVSNEPSRREWRRPSLRRLPIEATAGSGKATIKGNDGQGGGKGDVSIMMS